MLIAATYLILFDVTFANLILFWAIPAMLSAFQLFYFGTYRPHRHDETPFVDGTGRGAKTFPTGCHC